MSCKLVTFLGAGAYGNAEYVLDDGTSTRSHASPFVQVSMASLFQPDEVLLLLTEGARQANWQGTRSGVSLESCVEELPHIPFTPIDIPDGFTEAEIWDIFTRLADRIEAGDAIIFDVTHSFRSIPILALACMHYLRVLKDIEIRGVYYGCYEARDMNTPVPRAPIVNLTPFVDIMDWSAAVRSFVEKGDVADLAKLLRKKTMPRLSASKGQDGEARAMQDLEKTLGSMVNCVLTCRSKDLAQKQYFQRIRSLIARLESFDNTLPAFKPLLGLVEEKLASLECGVDLPQDVQAGMEAVNWAIEHGLLQQAYTLLQETVLSHLCCEWNLDPLDKKIRGEISSALQHVNRPHGKTKDDIRPEIIEHVARYAQTELPALFDRLTKRRNDFNHAGMNRDKVQPCNSKTTSPHCGMG
jgi:CRISPR-associated DxTHG motif protein